MRCRALTRGLDLEHRGQRPIAGRAAGTVGDGKESRAKLRELLARRTKLRHAVGRGRRKELEAEDTIRFVHRHQSRLPRMIADSAHEMMLYRMAPKNADPKPAT